MLSIQILGRPQLSLDGESITLARRKSRALVYYLAAHRRPLTREHLLGVFWPDHDRPEAQQTLRVTLHSLRKVLNNSLVVEKESLALAADTEVDARSFENHLSPPTSDLDLLTSILELWHGDFLDGFSLSDSPEFDDWVAAQRDRYRRLAARGFAVLADRHEKRGNYADALESLDRALAFDSLQEDLQRAYIHLLYLAGDRAGAIRRYESFRRLLKEEMGVPPMAETRAMYDAIIDDTTQATSTRPLMPARISASQRPTPITQSPTGSVLPFAGRDAQLRALAAWTAEEARRLVLIEGEPGIGKTRLAEEFIRQSNAIPIVGVAHELEHTLPYQPIVQGLRSARAYPEWPALGAGLCSGLQPVWRAEVARLLPELATTSATPQRSSRSADESRLWEGIYQFLIGLARKRPVILFLDDLHWAEASTLGLLGYLVRQPAVAPIVFLAATRPYSPRSPVAGLIQTLTREGRVERLNLTRLERVDVASISGRLSPAYSFPLAEWLMRTSEGVPYILAELVRYARENGVLLPNGVVNLNTISSSPVVPQTVFSLVQSRLRRLSDAARRVLDAGVAIGREFDFELVARVAALSENAVLDALDELSAAGLVRTLDGMSYAFDHSLTMEVAYREVSEARHRLLHRRVAEGLESTYHDRLESIAGMLAWHFAEGNSPERAAPYAFQAGQQAFRLAAWSEAVAFYEQTLVGTDRVQRQSVLMALGEARHKAGQNVQASEAFREALTLAESHADASGVDTARLALARSFLAQARYTEATTLASQVRDTGLPKNVVGAEFLWGTALSLEGADLVEAARHLRSAESLCIEKTPTDLASLAQIKFELGSIAAQQGDLPQAIALYREALDVAKRCEDQDAALPHLVLAYNNLAYHLHLLKDPSAQEHALAGLSLAQEKGLLGLQPYLFSTLGEIALARGDFENAEKHLTEGLAIAERLSIPERVAGLTANLGLLALGRGETCLAIHRLSTALARADALGTRHLVAQVRLWLAPLLPPAEGRAHLAAARAIAESGGRRRLLEEAALLEAQLSDN